MLGTVDTDFSKQVDFDDLFGIISNIGVFSFHNDFHFCFLICQIIKESL